MQEKTERVRGWARPDYTQSKIYRPSNSHEVREALHLGRVLARGGGISFGDVALNDTHSLIETGLLARSQDISLDKSAGILHCSSGVSQKEILRNIAPHGWILPAIPGSQNITIGGSIAADAHGKNHYMRGTISQHLDSIQIMLASGNLVEVSREKSPDLFWATVGGLGLTGVILNVKLNLQKIPSVYAEHKIIGFEDVDDLVDLIEGYKGSHEYILGWVDGNFKPGKPWQGALSVGRSVPVDEAEYPWKLPRRRFIKLPIENPIPGDGMLVSRLINRAINHKFRDGREEVIDVNRFFFPQDAISNWNLAFGSTGFVDYQCCVPADNGRDFFKEVHRFLNKNYIRCFLIAIKRFGEPERHGPFTFAQNGFSIALDMPLRPGTLDALNYLDEIVVDYNGRINTVKDSRISPAMLRKMYPRLDEWLTVKEKYDPEKIFCSDLSRRLELTPQ
jgi:FAD/FMN-containing dehydrogenase